MTVTVLPTDRRSPQQTILKAREHIDEMDHVVVIYIPKGKFHPIMYCSDMLPTDMCFLGTALQNHSLQHMEE